MSKSAVQITTMADPVQEQQDGPIYFWKPNDPEYGFLSQWYESSFQDADKSITYSSAEQ